MIWGVFFAGVTRVIIESQHVGIIVKVILYGAGAYVAMPSYGMLDELSIPPEQMTKHLMIQVVPSVAYIISSIVFAFWEEVMVHG